MDISSGTFPTRGMWDYHRQVKMSFSIQIIYAKLNIN